MTTSQQERTCEREREESRSERGKEGSMSERGKVEGKKTERGGRIAAKREGEIER